MAAQLDFNKLSVFPNIVNVNVLKGECPCLCVHCPVGIVKPDQRARHFGKQSMPLELFEQITEEIARYEHSAIRIHSVGEPLLWRDLNAAVRLLSRRRVRSWIFTCAVTNDRALLRTICEHVSIIEVSVNAVNREEYRATKGIDAFDKVMENIRYMSEYIRENRLPGRLLLSRVQTPDESGDRQFWKYWTEQGVADDVFIRSFHNYNNLLDIQGISDVKKPCLVHWARASIDCDGTMVCCFNELFKLYSSDIVLGKVDKETSIQQIWQGEKLRKIRQCDSMGDFSGLGFRIPCETCETCQPADTLRDTSEKQLLAFTNNTAGYE
jgi:MoaA/NifB/PqqE/SkfB family radical SAM enzyme